MVGVVGQQCFLGYPHGGPECALVSLPGCPSPHCFPCLGASGPQHKHGQPADTKGLGGRCARWVLCWLWGRLALSWLGSRARLGSRALLRIRRSPSVSYPAEMSLESSS